MNLSDTIGFIGAVFFLIKIAIHMIIKRSIDTKFDLWTTGKYTNPIYFFPITEKVNKEFKTLKMIGNFIYYIALILIAVFLIDISIHKESK